MDRVRWEEAQADLIAYYEATGKRDVAEAKSRVAHLGLSRSPSPPLGLADKH